MLRIFTGFDQREAIGWHAFSQSLIERSHLPFSLSPLADFQQRDGSNAFTYARFLVPFLCDYQGFAIFLDGADMIALADIHELAELYDPRFAVQVVKHDYKTRFPRKYLGTAMECHNHNYPRKNWSSVILWNCGHKANLVLSQEWVEDSTGEYLHRFGWLNDNEIGALPREWNWLADEYGRNEHAKLLHFTAGIPHITAHKSTAHSGAWFAAAASMLETPAQARKLQAV